MALMWVQANRTADNVAGFIDIVLTQAMSMANSLPDIADPLSVIGKHSFVQTCLLISSPSAPESQA